MAETCSTSPGTGAPTCSSTSTRSWPRRLSARSWASPASPTRSAPRCRSAILDDTAARLARLWREHGLDVPPYAGCFRAGYLDICPPSVQTMPVDHIAHVQPLRPVSEAVRRRRRRGTRSSTSPWAPSRTAPELLREVVAGVAALPVRVLVAVGPRAEPASLGQQPDACAGRVVGRPGGGAVAVLGRRLARRLRHLPGRPGARTASALPAAGGRPVPQRRGRDPGGRRAGPRDLLR